MVASTFTWVRTSCQSLTKKSRIQIRIRKSVVTSTDPDPYQNVTDLQNWVNYLFSLYAPPPPPLWSRSAIWPRLSPILSPSMISHCSWRDSGTVLYIVYILPLYVVSPCPHIYTGWARYAGRYRYCSTGRYTTLSPSCPSFVYKYKNKKRVEWKATVIFAAFFPFHTEIFPFFARSSVADPHHFDAGPDPACHFDRYRIHNINILFGPSSTSYLDYVWNKWTGWRDCDYSSALFHLSAYFIHLNKGQL